MKKQIATILVLFLFSFNLGGQITTVKLSLEFNESTNLFDCFLFVGSGSTRPDMPIDRILFNSQISVVSHVGSEVSIADLYMPLLDNMEGNGTEPLSWVIANTFESPVERPDLKYHAIIPNLSPEGHFNNLSPGSKVRLFSISASPIDTCQYKLRLFDKQVDKHSFNGFDFNNGITIGSTTQLYLGNIDDNFTGGEGPVIEVDSSSYCEQEVVQIGTMSNGIWISSDTSVAKFVGQDLITNESGEFYIWFVEDSSNCNSNISELQVVFDRPEIDNGGIDTMIVGESLMLTSDLDCMWFTSDGAIAEVSDDGLVNAISPGNVVITAVDTLNGCENSFELVVDMVSSVAEFYSIYKIYPNPVSNLIYVKGLQEGDKIEVLDQQGRVFNISNNNEAIDVSFLPDGIYILSIQSSGEKVSKRFTKLSH